MRLSHGNQWLFVLLRETAVSHFLVFSFDSSAGEVQAADSLKSKRGRTIPPTLLFDARPREERCELKVKDFRHARWGVACKPEAGSPGCMRCTARDSRQPLYTYLDQRQDRFIGRFPVGCFLPSSYGLYDMASKIVSSPVLTSHVGFHCAPRNERSAAIWRMRAFGRCATLTVVAVAAYCWRVAGEVSTNPTRYAGPLSASRSTIRWTVRTRANCGRPG